MTLSTTGNVAVLETNGATTSFPFPFKVLDADSLIVQRRDPATGVVVKVYNNSEYTVSGVGSDSGTVTISPAPVDGYEIVIIRRVALTQNLDIVNQGGFYPETIEDQFDFVVMQLQQIAEQLNRTLSGPAGSSFNQLASAAFRAGKFLTFDANGQPSLSSGSGSDSGLRTDLAKTGLLAGASNIGLGVGGSVDDAIKYATPQTFGAAADGVTDDTAAVNAALAANKTVVFGPGTYNVTTIEAGQDDSTIWLQAGATINLQDEEVTGLLISGENVSIVGPGKIFSPAVFDGTNARRTYATIWITGDRFTCYGVTMENIPRSGIHFEDATNGRIINNTLIGNYPYADYNDAATTGHCGIDYNPPTAGGSTTDSGNGSLLVLGNRIEKFIQGVFFGNFDSAAFEGGVIVVGNTFNRCWDHGVYATLCKGTLVASNSFLNCRRPVAIDGIGGAVIGNTFYATETSQTNGQQDISVREATDCLINGNTFYGPSSGISVDCISGNTIKNVRITGNTLTRTGSGQAADIIRVGQSSQVCEDVVIEGNTILDEGYLGASNAAIRMYTSGSSYRGKNCSVRNNTIILKGEYAAGREVAGVQATWFDDLLVEGNRIRFTTTGSSANAVVRGVLINDCSRHIVRGNTFMYQEGGVNVIYRPIQTDSVGTVENNIIDVSSGDLSSQTTLDFVHPGSRVSRNQINQTAAFAGVITIASGAASGAVTNNNVRASWTKAVLTPKDNGAGALVASPGVKTVVTDNTITISTSDGTNAPALATFDYVIF